MSDIFNRRTDIYGGSFAADALGVTFANLAGPDDGGSSLTPGGRNPDLPQGNVGLLMQSLQIGYQQQITRLYEIGSAATFFVAGRTSGSSSVARVLGPRRISTAFYTRYGDVCAAPGNHLQVRLATGCRDTGQFPGVAGPAPKPVLYFQLCNVVITSIGIAVNAQDAIVSESLQLMFTALKLQEDAAAG